MHLLLFWAVAFVTLCVALALLNIYDSAIGNDLVLRSAGQEAMIAGVAALVEAGGVWLVMYVLQGGGRAMILPALVVGMIYKVAHFEDWGKSDIVLLLLFQVVVWFTAASLYGGDFKSVLVLWVVFGGILGLVASFSGTSSGQFAIDWQAAE